jgi:2-oxoglutarate ferredoxin oxidoreductase subunit alpha
MNQRLLKKYRQMEKEEKRWEEYNISKKMKVLAFAWGTMSRICKTAIDELKNEGLEVGLFRPITLYPFPYEAAFKAIEKADKLISVELSTGQMIDDVKLASKGRDVAFFGRQGGIVPTPEDVKNQFIKLAEK